MGRGSVKVAVVSVPACRTGKGQVGTLIAPGPPGRGVPPVLDVRGLRKHYGEVRAVDGLDLQVEEGEVVAFLGPNGAGKTTTIKVLTTLAKPTSGTAAVCGHDVLREPVQVRRCLGYVSQDVALDRTLTGREHLELQAALYHLPKALAKERIAHVLELVELADRADEPVRQYSGGMRKRLDIACGLVHKPRVLLLDEPTLGLDLQTRRRIWDAIRALKSEGLTVLLTTHYLEEADQLADRVAIIDRGRIVALGKPSDLKAALGGDTVEVRLANGASTQALAEDLQAMPGVASVAPSDRALRVVVREAGEAIPRIVALAAKHGHDLEALTYARPSLDDVFLQHTGRSLRDAEGDVRAQRALRRMRA
jgi:ABC-2 type transport system ATP-binding protein